MQKVEINPVEATVEAEQHRVEGAFQLVRRCGVGASADVYEAVQRTTGQRVALKRLKRGATPAAQARFRAEAALLASLRCEHIVRLDEDHSIDGYFTMELLAGESLEQLAQAPLSPARVLQILRPLAQALDAAHRHGVVHCDVKPENVIVACGADGELAVKLLDFGIARRPSSGSQSSDWFGTPLYMSPEQALGRMSTLDVTTDVWALAQLTYRLLSGQSYYPSEPVQRTLLRIAFDPIDAPSALGCRLSPAFDAWFSRSCAREPQRRFQSVIEQVDALAPILADTGVELAVRSERRSWICDGETRPPTLAKPAKHQALALVAASFLLSFYAFWS